MKQVFKCDYCNFMGIQDVVAEHEKTCTSNPKCICCSNCRYKRGTIFQSCVKGRSTPLLTNIYNCPDFEKVYGGLYND